jgi:hypothetical protein
MGRETQVQNVVDLLGPQRPGHDQDRTLCCLLKEDQILEVIEDARQCQLGPMMLNGSHEANTGLLRGYPAAAYDEDDGGITIQRLPALARIRSLSRAVSRSLDMAAQEGADSDILVDDQDGESSLWLDECPAPLLAVDQALLLELAARLTNSHDCHAESHGKLAV